MGIDQLAWHVLSAQSFILFVGNCHVRLCFSNPQSTAIGISAIVMRPCAGYVSRPSAPNFLRGLTNRQFGWMVIHQNQMSHTCPRCTTELSIHNPHGLSTLRQCRCTGCADNTRSDDDHVCGWDVVHDINLELNEVGCPTQRGHFH